MEHGSLEAAGLREEERTMPTTAHSTGPAAHRLGIAFVLMSTIAWGSGGLFVRLLPFDLWTIVFWRGVFGTVFVGAYVLWRFGWETPRVVRRIGAAGIVATACATATITLFVAAFQHTSVANAMTIYAAMPFFTAAIAWLWLRERPSPRTMAASGLALLGIVVMLGPAAGGPRSGDLLAMLATAAMALLTVVIRRHREVEMLPVAALSIALQRLSVRGPGHARGRDYLRSRAGWSRAEH